jgi:hypothetical protein
LRKRPAEHIGEIVGRTAVTGREDQAGFQR